MIFKFTICDFLILCNKKRQQNHSYCRILVNQTIGYTILSISVTRSPLVKDT